MLGSELTFSPMCGLLEDDSWWIHGFEIVVRAGGTLIYIKRCTSQPHSHETHLCFYRDKNVPVHASVRFTIQSIILQGLYEEQCRAAYLFVNFRLHLMPMTLVNIV